MGSLGGISPGGSLAIGILVGLASTSIQSLGLTLQRKSHLLEDEKYPHDVRRPPYRRRRWQLGMGMFVVSNILGSSIQISTLPLPVLSTLQAAGLVFNSICATLILGEPFTRWSFWGTALVTSGAALIAIFGAIPSPAHSLRELLDLLGGRGFIIWMSLQVVLVVAMATIVDLLTYLTKWSKDIRFRLIRGLTYGCISGILSAHSLLFAKSAVELILRTIADSDNQFVHWQSWMLVLALVTLALTQLYYLHRGLKLVSTSVLYPLVFCVYNIIAILDGLIYFQQTSLITPLHGGLIALGTVILLSGVLALSWRLSDEQHPPAVGQSTLTPGLGLVEDTEGEEEDSLIDSDAMSDEDSRVPPTYNTFAPNSPGTPSRKTTNPWLERTEIWDELEDQETASLPPPSKSRSSIVPSTAAASENAPLLNNTNTSTSTSTNTNTHKRGVSGDSTNSLLTTTASNADAPRKLFRRRRRSTGFPGFKARAHERTTTHERRKSSASGSQDATGGFWKLKWWRDKKSVGAGDAEAALGSPSSLGLGQGWGAESSSSPPPSRYRDRDGDPEEFSGSRNGGDGGGDDDDTTRQRDPPAARNRSGDGSGGGGAGDDAV